MKKQIVALTAIAALSVGAAGQASASSVHTVEKGETLWSISKERDVTVQDLQVWNGLESTVIFPAQELKIEDKPETHVVVLGDSLFNIAKQHNISVDELMDRNQLTSDLIHPGDELIIEGTKKIVPKVSAASLPSADVSNETAKTAEPAVAKATAPVEKAVKELTVTSTAYTASCAGCSGVTATGIDLLANPNQKVISVDPSVIPLGSKVWVEGYGEAIAGDTGGAIKGNKIDIFIPSKEEAVNWGKKTVKVKILD
ncbi:LysM peptidoglycan-binding and 3D domain-containing protein [Psychrobacillus lasiicapitis]|uniref:LysM peptidoglycan-binding domain-containing protein n=1 Tax=Psychrobacillus lasiicapitis TaxID=1636719 RepID=A0A544T712_9BACI|nr:3D domain-containing protein [Psychrobacillus lasiicapitis]TQR13226.1 LysM peptidoglycan-binding domain-containing protein [Psychrobacillus lasiicapitis]GGA33415.1 cell wall-binding protein YocH [Psychrobacillus lasiicapitis]